MISQELKIDTKVLSRAHTTTGTFVRVVDPNEHVVLYQDGELEKLFPSEDKRPCFHFWGRDIPCEPCLSGEAIKCGAPQSGEAPGARGVTYRCYTHPFINPTDGSPAALEIIQDVTREKALEHAIEKTKLRLLETQTMATVGNMAGSVVHAIRNPLSGITLYTDMLLKKVETNNIDPNAFKEGLMRIKDSASRCEDVAKNLLKLARAHKYDPKPVNLKEVIEQGLYVVSPKLNLKKVNVQKEFSNELPAIMGDFSQLQLAFINLFSNAIDAMSDGGTLTIKGHSFDSTLEVKVVDTGCGIPKEHLPRLFGNFFSTKGEHGTGLGLTQSQKIVQTHHGSLSVDSEVGRGTTVTVRLPVKKQPILAS
jgi:signal transduction histidine kinase